MVQRCRVGFLIVHEVFDEINVIAPEFGAEEFLARSHPITVTSNSVDFAVVAHHAERLTEGPRWEGIGGEALVVK